MTNPLQALVRSFPFPQRPHFCRNGRSLSKITQCCIKGRVRDKTMPASRYTLRLTTHRIKWQDGTANFFNHRIHHDQWPRLCYNSTQNFRVLFNMPIDPTHIHALLPTSGLTYVLHINITCTLTVKCMENYLWWAIPANILSTISSILVVPLAIHFTYSETTYYRLL